MVPAANTLHLEPKAASGFEGGLSATDLQVLLAALGSGALAGVGAPTRCVSMLLDYTSSLNLLGLIQATSISA
jgi:hypothetical protein